MRLQASMNVTVNSNSEKLLKVRIQGELHKAAIGGVRWQLEVIYMYSRSIGLLKWVHYQHNGL